MVTHIIEGAVLIALMVLIHGVGTLVILWVLGWYRPHSERRAGVLMNAAALTWVVGMLVVLHLMEVGVWAGYYYRRGVLPDLETSVYYSLLTYTTVGYGDVVLSKAWRIMGTSEALVGVLMTAWSTALLLGVINAFHGRTVDYFRNKGVILPPVR